MVVEIDPADVVSVPNDCDCQKLRTSKYKVVAHFEKKLEEPMCDEYGDWDDVEESSEDSLLSESAKGDAYNAGYEAAKRHFGNSQSSSGDNDSSQA